MTFTIRQYFQHRLEAEAEADSPEAAYLAASTLYDDALAAHETYSAHKVIRLDVLNGDDLVASITGRRP